MKNVITVIQCRRYLVFARQGFQTLLILLMLGMIGREAASEVEATPLPRTLPVNITKPSATSPISFDGREKTLNFQATWLDQNLDIGRYTLSWLLAPQRYEVVTSLTPGGFVSLFYSNVLRERSEGQVQNNQLVWRHYELQELEDNNPKPLEKRTVKRIGDSVQLNGGKEVMISSPPFDLPSIFIALMLEAANADNTQSGSQWEKSYLLLTSKKSVNATIRREPDERLVLDKQTFDTRVYKAIPENPKSKLRLQLWFDQAHYYPVKIIFTNSKDRQFQLELEDSLTKID